MSDSIDAAVAQMLGKELLTNTARGVAGGLGAAGLYHLLSGLNKTDLTSVLPQSGVSGFAGNRPKLRKKREQPSRSKTSPVNVYKTATADSFLSRLERLVGQLPTSYIPGMSSLLRGAPRAPALTPAQEMWRNIANVGVTAAGGYAGLKTVNTIADNMRQEDIKNDVDAARDEYFAALTGKNAAYLDAAFEKQNADKDTYLGIPYVDQLLAGLDRRLIGPYVATPAALTALSTGLVGGTYMYNQTKKRTRAENLQRAAAARARLAGLQKTPYVDPVELAALTKK